MRGHSSLSAVLFWSKKSFLKTEVSAKQIWATVLRTLWLSRRVRPKDQGRRSRQERIEAIRTLFGQDNSEFSCCFSEETTQVISNHLHAYIFDSYD